MPQDEEIRIRRLRAFGVLDTPAEQRFDRITRMAADIFKAPIALVSLVDAERQWFKSRVGLDVAETPRSQAFCAHAIEGESNSVMVVENARLDPRFAHNPLVVGDPGIQFYAGAALTTSDGDNLGTLCVIDREPRRQPSDQELDRLRQLAAIVVDEMELSRRIKQADDRLALLKLSESLSGVGFWRYDVPTANVFWSDQVYAVYGVDPQTFDPKSESAAEAFHPEDRPILEGLIRRAIATGEGYTAQLRLRRSDGTYRHVAAKAVTEADAYGKTIALTGVFQDITDYVTARAAAEDSEARYRLLADTSSDVVLKIGIDGKFEYVSPSMKQFGWSPDELVNRRVADFLHPDDAGRTTAVMTALFAGEVRSPSDGREFRIRKTDGKYVWVEVSRSVVRNDDGSPQSLISQLRDISERREALEKLTESELRYRLIANNTTDVIGRTSLEGVMLYVSPAIERLAGYSVEEMLGRKTINFMHPDDVGSVVAAFREVVAGQRNGQVIRHRLRHKTTGEWIWVEANPRLAVGPTGELEFIDVLRDINNQVALEAAMLRAKSAAEAGARAKADFLANMSHEIRTPLNGIVGYAALLESSPDLPARHRRHADVISASSNGLIRIVNDILDFSALDSGEVGFEMRPFDIRELLRTSVETLQVQAKAKGISLRTSADPRLPDRLLGDDARIRQVLLNLIGNAIKFTRAGHVDIFCEPISNGLRQTLRCTVRDTGIGIPGDKIGRIFSRFSQADNSTSRRYGGTGLGLAISQKIVKAMGGEIGVDSVEGIGSTFWFTLPLAETTEADLASDAATAEVERPSRPRRILVVDDYDINRDLAAALLSPMGHEVVLASGGEQAIQLAEREAFDLIFMDIQMPVMDGFAATRAIRALDVGSSVPIVALTAHAMRQQIEECLLAGMNGHVAKPFTAAILRDAIAKWAPQQDENDQIATSDAGFSLEVREIRRRFVARAAADAAAIERFMANPSPESEIRAKSVVHRLAGTAGSLGFQEAGEEALAVEASVMAGDPLRADSLVALLSTLRNLQKGA